MLFSFIREEKKDFVPISIEKLSNKSLESNEIDDLSGELGVGTRRMGDRKE